MKRRPMRNLDEILPRPAANIRMIGLVAPSVGESGINCNKDMTLASLLQNHLGFGGERDFIAGKPTANKGAAPIRTISIDRAAAFAGAAMTAPSVNRLVEVTDGRQHAAQRTRAALMGVTHSMGSYFQRSSKNSRGDQRFLALMPLQDQRGVIPKLDPPARGRCIHVLVVLVPDQVHGGERKPARAY